VILVLKICLALLSHNGNRIQYTTIPFLSGMMKLLPKEKYSGKLEDSSIQQTFIDLHHVLAFLVSEENKRRTVVPVLELGKEIT